MFTWLNNQGVKSDQGFIVQSVSRFVIEYREGLKIIAVSVERGLLKNGKACVYIYPDEFEKWSDGVPIKENMQKRILKNFIAAMNFQEVDVLIDSPAER